MKAKKSASGIPAGGASRHAPPCECPRCQGFQPGNALGFQPGHQVTRTHGAYSLVEISLPAEQLADAIRPLLPVYEPVDEAALRALAVILIRIQRAEAALAQLEREAEEAGKGPLSQYSDEMVLNGKVVRADGLKADLRGWLRVAENYFGMFGMTPGSRVKLGLDLLRAKRFTVLDLHRQAALEEEDAA